MNKLEKEINNLSEDEAKDMLWSMINDTYTVVTWPDSQNYMNKKWFMDEAILDVDSKFGDSAYLIPTKYVMN